MKTVKMLSSIALILILAVSIHSEEKKKENKGKNFEIGIYAGMTDYKDLDKAFSFGFDATKKISESLGIQLRVGYQKMDIDKEYEAIDQGDLKVLPLQLSLIYYFNFDKFKPYILGGGGYYIVSFDNASESSLENLGFEVESDMDNKFGFHAGAGVDYQLSDKFTLNADFRYVFADLNGTYKITEQNTGIIKSGNYNGKLDNFSISLGFKYYL